MIIQCRRVSEPSQALSLTCPCQPQKPGIASQRQPSPSIGDALKSEGFTRTIEDGREADFRLANRRLQPLGHLTASCEYTVNRQCQQKCMAARDRRFRFAEHDRLKNELLATAPQKQKGQVPHCALSLTRRRAQSSPSSAQRFRNAALFWRRRIMARSAITVTIIQSADEVVRKGPHRAQKR